MKTMTLNIPLAAACAAILAPPASAAAPEPPILVEAGAASDSITIAWESVDSATGYFFDASAQPLFGAPGAEIAYCAGASADLNALGGWTPNNPALSTGSIALVLTNGSTLVSPALDLAQMSNAQVSFNARFYNNGGAAARTIHVEVSESATDWSGAETAGTFLPLTNEAHENSAVIGLERWCGRTVWLRLRTGSASNAGAAVNNISVKELTDDFLPSFQNFAVNGTETTVSGLLPETQYYFRARSTDGAETGANSATLAAWTLPAHPDEVTDFALTGAEYDRAEFAWQGADGATACEIEVSRTNSHISAAGPRVLITKVYHRGDEGKALELTNIGGADADLAEYSFDRRHAGANAWGAYPIAFTEFTPANGASVSTLPPGGTVLLLHASGTTNPTDAFLKNAAALRSNSMEFRWEDGDLLGVFHNGALADTAPAVMNFMQSRAFGISEGRAEADAAEWTRQAYSIPPGAAALDRSAHVVAIPVSTAEAAPPAPRGAAQHTLHGLEPRTDYVARVRAVNAGGASAWTDFVRFTTPEPPKRTLIILR